MPTRAQYARLEAERQRAHLIPSSPSTLELATAASLDRYLNPYNLRHQKLVAADRLGSVGILTTDTPTTVEVASLRRLVPADHPDMRIPLELSFGDHMHIPPIVLDSAHPDTWILRIPQLIARAREEHEARAHQHVAASRMLKVAMDEAGHTDLLAYLLDPRTPHTLAGPDVLEVRPMLH